MVTCRKACDMSKVLECCRQKRLNLHSKLCKYSLPNLHTSSLPLKLDICLHSHVPEFIELKNSLPKSLDLNSVNYSVWGIVTDKIITTCCCCSTLCSNPVQCSMDLSGRKILPDEYRETSYLVKTCGRRRRSIIKICLWYRRQTAPPLIALRARWNRFLSHFSPTGPPNVHYSLSLSLSCLLYTSDAADE